MSKREFLQLAHVYDKAKHGIGGYFWSEKLNGQRCYWDGGITRGLKKADVPWANIDKDARYKKEQICTGLWSRYGNIIFAPDWWLDKLPSMPLDGELWLGRGVGTLQKLRTIVSTQNPSDAAWQQVRYYCFGIPSYDTVFAEGEIDTLHYKKTIRVDMAYFIAKRIQDHNVFYPTPTLTFRQELFLLEKYLGTGEAGSVAVAHKHYQLPHQTSLAIKCVNMFLENITNDGGEGIILRDPDARYECARSHHILKVKKYKDAEATVIGYISGEETEKGSKLLGMMGSLICEYNGNQFNLSGFTDGERYLSDKMSARADEAQKWAVENPATKCPDWIENPQFPIGSIVTFRYTETTKDGIPVSASYLRPFEVE